ncbi:MAG: hypothetical protein JSV61_14240 [Anaerolineales bacterium]|nr:MAG: hypothetical protein JSV61_14240 [Anaerolineales bacterium]
MTAFHNHDTSRLGFHYYPDTLHYSQGDLQIWLPVLKRLQASWLVLVAPIDRAIPEAFLRGLIEAHIQPILHFHLPLGKAIDLASLRLLFENYADWGLKTVILFDRPNTRQAWSSQSWVQSDLTERFLDIFLPPAEIALHTGLKPVLPPLEPGGDYWDTAYLQALLKGIKRRGSGELLEALSLSAYARVTGKSLHWGAGGPERWPKSRPYSLPAGHQDQRGFYIFDWYLSIAQAVLDKQPPVLLLGVGSPLVAHDNPDQMMHARVEHAEKNLALAQRVCTPADETLPSNTLDPISAHVLACNFWLLTATADSPHLADAWFYTDGCGKEAAESFLVWLSMGRQRTSPSSNSSSELNTQKPTSQSIDHYLLLPLFEWGVSEWYLDAIRPFILKHRPTIGFSTEEAGRAKRVTVIGGEQLFADNVLDELRNAGCRVDRISGDGTEIASTLSTL